VITAALGIAIALLLLSVVLVVRASRARARDLADAVRLSIEPYLRRKAAEAGLPATAPTWTARSAPEAIVTFSSTLAQRLLARDRAGGQDVGELENAKTQPADAPPSP
jgi:hypothetical protein